MDKIKSAIISMIDTGACVASILKDIAIYYPNQFTNEEIKDTINSMINNREIIDRGAYLVYKPIKYIKVPRNCISSQLPICPICGDTECVETPQQVTTLSINLSYRTECYKCNIWWDSYKTEFNNE